MTEENQKKMYDHFINSGQVDRVKDILKVYPHFAEAVKEEKTKSKGKK